MATTALGIMQLSDGTGVSPLAHRKTIQARWNNPGVIYGLEVTGGTGLTYHVSPGCAVVCRAVSDGYSEAYWEGGDTAAVSPGDPSRPRIDLVWIRANDPQQGDVGEGGEPTNSVEVGVASGTPAATPAAPACPAGCMPVAQMLVPAAATSTASATLADDGERAIPYGASLGLLVDAVDTSNAEMTKNYTAAAGSFSLPTDRYLAFKVTVTMASIDGVWSDGDGSVYCRIYIDGELVDARELRLRGGDTAISNYYEKIVLVASGSHRANLNIDLGVGTRNRRYYEKDLWAGQVLQVFDMGAVR